MLNRKKVGIFGGSGITGSELIRLLLTHPKLEISFVHSRHHANEKISSQFPYLQGLTDLSFSGETPEKLLKNADVVFLALGHGESKEFIPHLKNYSGAVIDLTLDHRISEEFVYGIPELKRGEISSSKRIANPGCFATSAILAAAPLAESGWVEPNYFFSSVTGSSGAGIKALATTHHPFREGNLFAYKVFTHPHEPEISLSLKNANVVLTAHSGPFVRGIYTTLHVRAKDKIAPERLKDLFEKYYREAPFVRIRDNPPKIKEVVGSNFCDLFVATRNQDLLVMSALDNLVKGAAGQAIQNANLALGLDEKEGLWNPPFFL